MPLSDIHILAISDLCITEAMYRQAFAAMIDGWATLNVIDWPLQDLNNLRVQVARLETEGAEALPIPPEMEEAALASDVIVTHLCPLPQRLIARAPRLRAIGCARGGVENVAVQAATDRGIPVLHCPLSKVATAADAAIGMILTECRGLARAHHQMVQGQWDAGFAFFGASMSLTGNTVGLIGFGNIGQAVARRLHGFEVELLVHDPYQPAAVIQEVGGSAVTLDELLARSDFVVLLARLSEASRGMIGGRELQLMKQNAYFINTARAGLVDYGALRDVLTQRRIAGAALDVFDAEPLAPDDPLLKLDNVTLTPHVAGVSREGYRRSAIDAAHDIRRLLEGGRPRFVVNPAVFDRQ